MSKYVRYLEDTIRDLKMQIENSRERYNTFDNFSSIEDEPTHNMFIAEDLKKIEFNMAGQASVEYAKSMDGFHFISTVRVPGHNVYSYRYFLSRDTLARSVSPQNVITMLSEKVFRTVIQDAEFMKTGTKTGDK